MGLSYCAKSAHNCTSQIVLLESITESGNMDSISEPQWIVKGGLNGLALWNE